MCVCNILRCIHDLVLGLGCLDSPCASSLFIALCNTKQPRVHEECQYPTSLGEIFGQMLYIVPDCPAQGSLSHDHVIIAVEKQIQVLPLQKGRNSVAQCAHSP